MRNVIMGLVLAWGVLVFAKEPISIAQAQQSQDEFRKKQEEYWKKQPQKQIKTLQDELEHLKETNPRLYEQRKNDFERQAKISAILKEFREGKLTAAQSQNQLFPLIREEQGPEISRLDDRIKRLEKQLAFMRSAKQNPDVLIKKRIEKLMGRSMADDDGAER